MLSPPGCLLHLAASQALPAAGPALTVVVRRHLFQVEQRPERGR